MSTHDLTFEEACMRLNERKLKEIESLIGKHNDWLSKTDSTGRRLLHWACLSGDETIVKTLVQKYGADVDAQDDMLWSPLMIAASAGREAVVHMLVELGADVNTTNSNGQNSLHYACSKNHIRIAEFLICQGIKLNHTDRYGNTPLHRTASMGRSALTDLLLQRGAVVHIADRQGNTPLFSNIIRHLACQEERLEDIMLLVKAGASLETLNKEEKTPLEYLDPKLRPPIVEAAKQFQAR